MTTKMVRNCSCINGNFQKIVLFWLHERWADKITFNAKYDIQNSFQFKKNMNLPQYEMSKRGTGGSVGVENLRVPRYICLFLNKNFIFTPFLPSWWRHCLLIISSGVDFQTYVVERLLISIKFPFDWYIMCVYLSAKKIDNLSCHYDVITENAQVDFCDPMSHTIDLNHKIFCVRTCKVNWNGWWTMWFPGIWGLHVFH